MLFQCIGWLTISDNEFRWTSKKELLFHGARIYYESKAKFKARMSSELEDYSLSTLQIFCEQVVMHFVQSLFNRNALAMQIMRVHCLDLTVGLNN